MINIANCDNRVNTRRGVSRTSPDACRSAFLAGLAGVLIESYGRVIDLAEESGDSDAVARLNRLAFTLDRAVCEALDCVPMMAEKTCTTDIR